MINSLPANAADIVDLGSIPGSGISSGGGNGNPLSYPCLDNSMDRGGWQATVHGVSKSWIRLSIHTYIMRTGRRTFSRAAKSQPLISFLPCLLFFFFLPSTFSSWSTGA